MAQLTTTEKNAAKDLTTLRIHEAQFVIAMPRPLSPSSTRRTGSKAPGKPASSSSTLSITKFNDYNPTT
jgi:hypothetical protein